MTVKYSLAHLTVLGTTPLDLIQIAADAGYDYVSIRMTPVADGEHVTPLAGDAGDGPPGGEASRRHRPRSTRRRTRHGSVRTMSPTSTAVSSKRPRRSVRKHVLAQLNDPDLDRAIERFGRLCDLALEFGLTVDLEFPSWSETGDLPGAAAVVWAVNRSNAGILVDALHFFRSNSSIEELAALPPEWFRFVQLCDAPADAPPTVEGVIHTARCARSLPGYGHLPLRELLAHLPAGPYSLEVPNDVLRRELGTTEYARLVLATARDVVADRGLPAMAH